MQRTATDSWQRFRRHVRELWPRYALVPPLLFVGWPLYTFIVGERRWELGFIALVGATMPYIGPRSKRAFLGIMPLGLTAILYDAKRFVEGWGISADRLHICDLRDLEMRFFGVQVGDRIGTVHDWIQARQSVPLDIFFSIPYGTFLGVVFLFALLLYFLDYAAMRRFSGAFLLVNALGLLTHHLYPAAAPWYFHAHGCVADLATRASEGPNLARVDAWFGVPFFRGLYARSHDVFGAMPSLHVAYPLMTVIEGYGPFGALPRAQWLKWPLRVGSVFFFLWMFAGAVYLDHHWILDLVCGCLYAVVATVALRKFRFFGLGREIEDAQCPTTTAPPPARPGEAVWRSLSQKPTSSSRA